MSEAHPISDHLSAVPQTASPADHLADYELADAYVALRRRHNWPAARGSELCAVVLLVVLFDAMVYRGHGFAGYTALFLFTPALLAVAAPRPRQSFALWIVAGMLLLLAAKLLWAGSWGLVAGGFLLVVAFAMTLAGHSPYVMGLFAFAGQTPLASLLALADYRDACQQISPNIQRGGWLQVLLPAAAVICFGTLFVLANPDVVTAVSDAFARIATNISEFLAEFSPGVGEVVFWLLVAMFSVGLLRPFYRPSVLAEKKRCESTSSETVSSSPAPLYGAYRNTLVSLIVLFAVYLCFEFATLWFREFEKGFYYSGYAHEGAAWLTIALALATVVLSVIFRGKVLQDERLAQLRKLAWIWSAGNLLLAVAVFNRMHIYVGFNGMTRMRVVGLFGISAVVAGFVLVVWKITSGRGFFWLIQRQLWALAVAVYLLMIVPVDAVVHSYNVERILNGDPAPAVQISVHPISSDGITVITPLLKSEDATIREGVRAILAERAISLKEARTENEELGWTAYQAADEFLWTELERLKSEWQPYADDEAKREKARTEFDKYAYQWY